MTKVTQHVKIFSKLLLQINGAFEKEQICLTRSQPLSFFQVTVPIDPINIGEFLKSLAVKQKLYWADRSGTQEVAGIGFAYHESMFTAQKSEISTKLQILQEQLKSSKFFCCMGFDPSFKNDQPWGTIPSVSFIIPQFEFRREKETYTFTYSGYFPKNPDRYTLKQMVLENLKSLEQNLCRDDLTVSVPLNFREYIPSQDHWRQSVSYILELISEGYLEKIVLARRTHYLSGGLLEPFSLFFRLAYPQQNTFRFYIQFDHQLAFWGASPERLYKRTQRAIFTEALAGTRKRSDKPQADAVLQQDLLQNAKEQQEHRIVVRDIERKLSHLCTTFMHQEFSQTFLLSDCCHLYCEFQGTLKHGINDGTILTTLHPTPAICGTPVENAKKLLRQLETFSRGMYAGVIGWSSQEESEFAVTIRSALAKEDSLYLFAGAGIVQGSHPEQEWEELNIKLTPYTRIIEESYASTSE